jgi:signal transduction histidine kinase
LGNGVFGGVVVSYSSMTADASKIILEIEHGSNISEFPVTRAESYYSFDFNMMNRFNIKKSDISKVYKGKIKYINDKLSFFEKHKMVIIPTTIIIVILILFSIFSILVNEQKRIVVNQLKERRKMLNNLLDNIAGGILIYKINNSTENVITVSFCSEGIAKIFGYSKEDFETDTINFFKNIIPQTDIKKIKNELINGNTDKKSIFLRFRGMHKNGSSVLASANTTWAYNEKDGTTVYYAVVMDNTQQEKILKAEQEALKAKISNDAKSVFLSRMSHDIRTPLNAVLGFTELAMKEQNIPHEVIDYLTKIDTSGKYLLGLINDILDISKIESGKVELHEKNVNTKVFLDNIVEVFKSQAEEKGISFITDFSEAPVEWLIMDDLRTRQIYSNLLNNAIKFSQSGSEIHWTIKNIFIDDKNIHTVCSISNQGCGMTKEFMKKMFKPFEQDNQTYSTTGTGLGLSIVKNLIDLMGGTIHVKSEVGKGSSFTFELDRKLGTPQEEPKEKEKYSYASLTGNKILLSEDNHINAIITEKLLSNVSCEVDIAENGKICVDKFTSSKPNEYAAILMDIRMPIMDGLEATKAIRKLERPDAKTIPIIAMSANAYDEDIHKSLEAGMNDHIAKPVDPEKLYDSLVQQIISKDKQNAWNFSQVC